MSSDRTGGAIEFLMASPGQRDDVLAVLDEAAATAILGRAAGIARERGREALRLDCVTQVAS